MVRRTRRPRALIYRGPAATRPCSAAVAKLLRSGPWNFEIRYVGPREKLPLDDEILATAALYVQPGGNSLDPAFEHLRPHVDTIRTYVRGGGRYLGICLGGYLAGSTPGFGLVPGDADRYIESRSASVRHSGDAVIPVRWRNNLRHMYFQDGSYFVLHPGLEHRPDNPVDVLARYDNGTIAALSAPYGRGRVAVCGPHPEADDTWYPPGLTNPDGIDFDLGHDLIDAVMTP